MKMDEKVILRQIIDQCDDSLRDVFLRRYYFFDSIEQIATRHGFSASKVKSMLHRTKGRLAAHLKKEGFEP